MFDCIQGSSELYPPGLHLMILSFVRNKFSEIVLHTEGQAGDKTARRHFAPFSCIMPIFTAC